MKGKRTVRLGNWRISVPGSAILRIILGVLLVLGGFLWFLPLLGIWMLPLGVILLSVDLPYVRRLRRRSETWMVPWFRRLRRWQESRRTARAKETHAKEK